MERGYLHILIQCNTILVDDSPTKAAHDPRNIYVMKEFDVGDAMVDCRSDSELDSLMQWLAALTDTDVRLQLDERNKVTLENSKKSDIVSGNSPTNSLTCINPLFEMTNNLGATKGDEFDPSMDEDTAHHRR